MLALIESRNIYAIHTSVPDPNPNANILLMFRWTAFGGNDFRIEY